MSYESVVSVPGCSTFLEISSDDDDIMEVKKDMVMEISSDEENIDNFLKLEGLPKVLNNAKKNIITDDKNQYNNDELFHDSNHRPIETKRKKRVPKKQFSLYNNPIATNSCNTNMPLDNSKKENVSNAKLKAIKKLFPPEKCEIKKEQIPNDTSVPTVCTPMVAGVKVKLPVSPYSSQIALMYNFIKSIKESKNCILESPTGSGKTLALLCGVLAWQEQEKNSKAQELEQQQAELSHVMETYSPASSKPLAPVTPEKLFTKPSFGEKSIYENAEVKVETSSLNYKRPGPYMDPSTDEASSSSGLVNIHKKPRHLEHGDDSIVNQQVTPEKTTQSENKETPESIRKMYDKLVGLHFHSVPTVYYGARTHTQLQQVIKEFKRTAYCGTAKMTILSSRDKTCIKEFDRNRWSSKDDMCRTCIKTNNKQGSNCEFYDRRRNMTHDFLPNAFDLEELVSLGHENRACPYFGARILAKNADIVFCPYNYLIDPAIRSSMQISLQDNIIVIDEAHNIESICRDAASRSFTQKQVQAALKELQRVAEYRFKIQDIEHYLDSLIGTLKSWNDWFSNQIPILTNKAANSGKVVHSWDVQHFGTTLENHNIGYSKVESFKANSEMFCRRLREDPRTLLGVTQATSALLESLSMVLGYLFRDEHKHMEDFKPVLEADVIDIYKSRTLENLTLHLHCLNSAIVMASLHVARCIALASGTLTPMLSIHAELGTSFPMTISPVCKMAQDKVWIGIVKGDEQTSQEYTYSNLHQPTTQDRFGDIIEKVCELTPHGVLCFVNSYATRNNFIKRWKITGFWSKLNNMKHVFLEQKTAGEHEEMMKDFYEKVCTKKGALLLAVYRGKVSEGMDFKDHQARAVICMGIPYPNMYEIAVKAKIEYNEKYKERGLLGKNEWMQIQAYRALNQAIGRCVRHKQDWGAVLLVDSRYTRPTYTEHLSKWVCAILNNKPYTYETLESREDGLAQFMERMKIDEEQDAVK